ncbi:MAG TPA: phosphatidate cytidylyltransferase [Flavobacteriaceae bacterium]|nr:phosphatidate cytidylyltransferase [Flavobacteriaceae bacterium]
MREIFIRAVSGAFYVLLLLAAILFSEISFLLLFLIFGIICLQELQRLLNLKSFLPYIVLFFLILLFGYFKIAPSIVFGLLGLTVVVNLLLIVDLLSKEEITWIQKSKTFLALFYMIASFLFLTLTPHYSGIFQPEILIGIFVLIWTNDTFAYLIGKSFGRHKLFKRISPNKTVEGFLGGIAFSFFIGYLIFIFTDELALTTWFGLALIISVFGTFGDLVQSRLKRQAAVKDSGTLMPGHGGLFDRLDSILFASAFVYGFLLLTYYVS